MDLFSMFTPEFIGELFSATAKADFTQKLIIIGICWKIMGKKVAAHFQSMESAVKGVSGEVKELRQSVEADFKAQSLRLRFVEQGQTELKVRVERLEGEKV